MKKDKSFEWNKTIQNLQENLNSIDNSTIQKLREKIGKKDSADINKIMDNSESKIFNHLDDLPKFDRKKHEENRIKNVEFCKCRNELENWQHHKQYCPIWKNGRIGELEQMVRDLVKENHKLMND